MNTATPQFDGHTPGEWKIKAINSRTNRVVGDETSSGWDKLHINGGNRTIAVVYREADARLIAAAPELLRQRDALASALKRLLNRLDWSGRPGRDPQQLGISSVDMDLATARNTLSSIENGA